MGITIYHAVVLWNETNFDSLFSQTWPLKIDPPHLQKLLKDEQESMPTEDGLSIPSLRYFWGYEEHLREMLVDESWRSYHKLDIHEINERINFIQDFENNPHYSIIDRMTKYHRSSKPVYIVSKDKKTSIPLYPPYRRRPDNSKLRQPVEFETASDYINHHIDAVNALRHLCIICRHENQPIKTINDIFVRYLFDVLKAVDICQEKYYTMEVSSAQCIKKEYRLDAIRWAMSQTFSDGYHTSNVYFTLQKFPLFESFVEFQKTIGQHFNNIYGGTIKFNKPATNKYVQLGYSRQIYDQYYWHQPKCYMDLQDKFVSFCNERNDPHKDYLRADRIDKLEATFITFLNSLLNSMLLKTITKFDLEAQNLVLECTDWPTALYTKLIVELQGKRKYSVCEICNQVFERSSDHTQIYCPTCIHRARSYQKQRKKNLDSINARILEQKQDSLSHNKLT